MSTMTTKTTPTSGTYNTSSLPRRLAIDFTSAISAASLIAPLITVIDKSIILRTHSSTPLSQILVSSITSAAKQPVAFLTSAPYLLILTLYSFTYTTANVTDTLTSTLRNLPAANVSAGPEKFLATSAANMSMCVYKDARFAKMFGAAAASASKAGPRAVPKTTLALFAARDSLTVFASFNVPPLLGPVLGSAAAAQFLAPASVQIVSTPLHLLGLDLYNRPRGIGAPSAGDRWRIIKRDWVAACAARIGRIVPAFGVGGVVNMGVRKRLMGGLD